MRRDRESAFSQLIARATRAIPPTVQKKLRPFFSWIPDAWTQSAVYRQALSEMRAADQWNLKQTEQFQLARLRRMIAHASHYAPAYTRRFAEQGLSRWTLSGLRDLEKFPF